MSPHNKFLWECLWRVKMYFQTSYKSVKSLMRVAISPSRPADAGWTNVHKWRQGPPRFPRPDSSQFWSPAALLSTHTVFLLFLAKSMFLTALSNFSCSGPCWIFVSFLLSSWEHTLGLLLAGGLASKQERGDNEVRFEEPGSKKIINCVRLQLPILPRQPLRAATQSCNRLLWGLGHKLLVPIITSSGR